MYVLTENARPIRKAHTAAKAWGEDVVAGHPTDSVGICRFDDGRTMEVRECEAGVDVWRVTTGSNYSFYYGTARALRKEYGFFELAERLNWDGSWEVVYN